MNASDARPPLWKERVEEGTFSGWLLLPRSESFHAVFAAVITTAPAVAYPILFDFVDDPLVKFVVPFTWGVIALAFWIRAGLVLFPVPHCRIRDGELSVISGPISLLHRTSLRTQDVVDVRASSRKMKSKYSEFDVWDVCIETRDGATHTMRLTLVSAQEAAWVARRLEEKLAGSQ